MTKVCSKCKEEKQLEQFYKCYGKPASRCKKCINEISMQYKWDHPDKRSLYSKKRYGRKRDDIIKRSTEWNKSHPTRRKEILEKSKPVMLQYRHEYYLKNKERCLENSLLDRIKNCDKYRIMKREYKREKRLNDIGYKLGNAFSCLLRNSLRNGKNGLHWESIVGYSLPDLKRHLENKFKAGMSWDNYGLYGWHIDHIIPRSRFKFSTFDDPNFKQCWALENLQPLWAIENIKKGNRMVPVVGRYS